MPNVSLKATRRNTVVHVGDGRRFRGPYTGEDADGDPEEIEGEIVHDVPEDAAGAIVARKLGKIVKTKDEAPAEA